MQKEFTHRHSAHCESGSVSNMLLNYGITISEPLVFGIGSGIFFGYFPFIRVQGMPAITFRNMPGRIMKNNAKRLGITFNKSKFKNPVEAMNALDRMIDNGVPVCLRTGVYWLPYMPDAMRFHFNVHHIVVYGRNGSDYLVSDPVFEVPVACSRKDLQKARFAEGLMAPHGTMFWLTGVPQNVELVPAIKEGIKEVCHVMIHFPLNIVGVPGIRTFARAVTRWPAKYGKRRAPIYLGHAIRMQEEIGTGGGGFRLMYAAFLHETARLTGDDRYAEISRKMTITGDRWREFAVHGARICKNRAMDGDNFNKLGELIADCAEQEYRLYKDLWKIVK